MARNTPHLLKLVIAASFVTGLFLVEGLGGEPKSAEKFADQVMEAVEKISDFYVLELNRREMVSWAMVGLYDRLGENMPPSIVARFAKAGDQNKDPLINLLAEGFENLSVTRKEIKESQLFDYAILSMLGHLAHAEYQPKRPRESWPSFGVGLELRKESSEGMIRVATPIRNGPAYKAGIRAGDVITKITLPQDKAGEPLDKPRKISTKGLTPSEVEALFCGPRGTKFKLTVLASNAKDPIQCEIVRELVERETVLGIRRKPNDDWDYLIDPEKKIGYIRLSRFSDYTVRDFRRALVELGGQGINGLILDLRFSPGGLLRTAVSIAEMFIKDGVITIIRDRKEGEVYQAHGDGKFLQLPLVCLVNGETAGTSEVLAASLQDHHRATIVGERTRGKGYIHNSIPIGDGQVTVPFALFYRANGRKLDRMDVPGRPSDEWGVFPDQGYEVKLSAARHQELAKYFYDNEAISRDHENDEKTSIPDRQLAMALDLMCDRIKTLSKPNH
jgi:carboxyl-terminal processing protease